MVDCYRIRHGWASELSVGTCAPFFSPASIKIETCSATSRGPLTGLSTSERQTIVCVNHAMSQQDKAACENLSEFTEKDVGKAMLSNEGLLRKCFNCMFRC